MKWNSPSLFVAIFTAFGSGQENYAQWAHYKNIALNTVSAGVTTDQIRFPVLVRLTAANADVFSGALAKGADLRFTKADGTTRLAYQIERWDSAGQAAAIWVQVDTVKGNNATQSIVMFWGKSGAADSSSGKAVFDTANGYAGVWHLNDTSSNVRDATANADSGANNGSTSATGVIGNGRSFNGTSNNISFGNPAALNFSGKITFSAWVNWTAGNGTRNILDHGQATGSNPEDYLRLNAGVYEAGSWNGTDHRAQFSAAGDSAHWVHLAGVYDGSNWILYRDGIQVVSTTDTAGALTSPDQNWSVGATGSGASRYFQGVIDEPRISKVARSADWIKLEYADEQASQTVVTLGATVAQGIPNGLAYRRDTLTLTEGQAFSADTPSVTGTVSRYNVAPPLPTGLQLDSATGILSGTPASAAASASYVITASNIASSVSDTLIISVQLAPPANLAYPVDTADYPIGQNIAPNIPTYAGSAVIFTVSPTLPVGLILDTISGLIWGTPTAASPAGNYTVTAANTAGSTQATLNLAVGTATDVAAGNTSEAFRILIPGSTTLAFHLESDTGPIRLSVVDTRGREIWNGRADPARGERTIVWNGTTASGLTVVRGVYLLRLRLETTDRKSTTSEQRVIFIP